MQIATLAIVRCPARPGEVLLGVIKPGGGIGIGTLAAPGGVKEVSDTLIASLIRGTKEQAGIDLNPKKLKRSAIVDIYEEGSLQRTIHVYCAAQFSGEPHETKSMVPGWYRIERPTLERMPVSYRWWFPDAALPRGKFPTFHAKLFCSEHGTRLDDIHLVPMSGPTRTRRKNKIVPLSFAPTDEGGAE